MTNTNMPYTYLIGWRDLDKWYYGCRVARNCHPSDLWNPYKTSSKYVESFIKQYGEPDVIRVHKTFASRSAAEEYEKRFLRKVKAKRSPRWINETIMGAPMGGSPNQIKAASKPKSEEWKRKMSKIMTGKKRPDMVEKMKGPANPMHGRAKEQHPRYGVDVSEETRRKISAALTGKPRAPRGPIPDSIKKRSPSHRKLVSQDRTKRSLVDHCRKILLLQPLDILSKRVYNRGKIRGAQEDGKVRTPDLLDGPRW